MKIIFAVFAANAVLCALAAFSVGAQEMVSKIGNRCPNNYASEGAFCVPLANAKEVIHKAGSRCPSGFSADGAYCYRPVKGKSKVIPKTGRLCPKGFVVDGDYCQSFK